RALGRRAQADHPEVILCVALVELLPEGGSCLRVRRHVDPGLRTVDSRPPGALPGSHVPLPIELGGVLAEVPDIALGVLRVPLAGAPGDLALGVEVVTNRRRAYALDCPRRVRRRDDLSGRLPVLLAAVLPPPPRLEREPPVVDRGRELLRQRALVPGGAAGRGEREHGCSEKDRASGHDRGTSPRVLAFA